MASSSSIPGEDENITAILSEKIQTANAFTVSKVEREAAKNWDRFYKRHQDKFFHDRHWTDREFTALKEAVTPTDESADSEDLVAGSLQGQSTPVLLEVGCGVGNMLYPLLEKNPQLQVHCCDFSARAVEIVKQHPKYDAARVNAFVYDLCQDPPTLSSQLTSSPLPSRPTLISCIFVLSAIPPNAHLRVLRLLFELLAPGGTLLFRDYGRGDLAQLRFHQKEKWAEPSLLSEEFDYYKRGDGTMTFFFGEGYLNELTEQLKLDVGDVAVIDSNVRMVERIGQNRKRGIELKRRFVQAYWRKHE